MRRMIYIFCLLAASCCLAQSAATARLGTLGKNDSVVTNVTFGGPASQLTDGTNIVTSARDVFRVLSADEIKSSPEGVEYQGWTFYMEDLGAIQISYGGTNYWFYWSDPGNWSHMSIDTSLETPDHHGEEDYSLLPPLIEFWRTPAGSTNFVGRLALTNDIPEVGPSAPAWDVATLDHIAYTNGMVDVTFTSTLSAVTNGWPDGASVFLRLHPSSDSYIPADPLRLVGYGVWPTNEAQAVAWRSGTNVFVNVILEVR